MSRAEQLVFDGLAEFHPWLPSLVTYLAYRFCLGPSEFLSIVSEALVLAERSYDPEKGRTLRSWVAHKLHWAAMDYCRVHYRWGFTGMGHKSVERVALEDWYLGSGWDPPSPWEREQVMQHLVKEKPPYAQERVLLWAAGYSFVDIAQMQGVTTPAVSHTFTRYFPHYRD